jgi:FAD synthetase
MGSNKECHREDIDMEKGTGTEMERGKGMGGGKGKVKVKGKRVLAAGCFDLLHYGHLRYLEEAKKLGGEGAELIVVVARDSTILSRKGRPPVMKEDHRRALVEALKPVDKAILGGEDFDTLAVIKEVNPDIIALGYDQDDLAELLAKQNLGVKIVKLGKYGEVSSSMIRKIIYSTNPVKQGPSAGPDPRP